MMKPVITSRNLHFHLVSSAKAKQPLLKLCILSSSHTTFSQIPKLLSCHATSPKVRQHIFSSCNLSYKSHVWKSWTIWGKHWQFRLRRPKMSKSFGRQTSTHKNFPYKLHKFFSTIEKKTCKCNWIGSWWWWRPSGSGGWGSSIYQPECDDNADEDDNNYNDDDHDNNARWSWW